MIELEMRLRARPSERKNRAKEVRSRYRGVSRDGREGEGR